jgi:hypothetical protein
MLDHCHKLSSRYWENHGCQSNDHGIWSWGFRNAGEPVCRRADSLRKTLYSRQLKGPSQQVHARFVIVSVLVSQNESGLEANFLRGRL